MSITLSSIEIEKLTRATQILVSPLEYGSVDDWRSAVNRNLKELLHADSAGFLLPVPEGLMLYSEEHDPVALSAFPDLVPPDMVDGTPLWEQMNQSRVATLANMYGRHYHRYLESEYYNEYAGANGAHDTLAASVSLGGLDGGSMACVHLWHERPDGRLFGEREITLLRLLYPALVAGVAAQARWGGERRDLVGTLDQLGHPALLCDLSGTVLHTTPSMEALLQADAEADHLRAELLVIVDAVSRSARGPCLREARAPGALVRELRTSRAQYRLSGHFYGRDSDGRAGYVVAGVERLTPVRRPPEELREVFSLTRAEIRVAELLGEGRSNAELARELFISPHTARRHTERVLQKMGIRSRSEVGARLYG